MRTGYDMRHEIASKLAPTLKLFAVIVVTEALILFSAAFLTPSTAFAAGESEIWDSSGAPDITSWTGDHNVITVESTATGVLVIPRAVTEISLNGPGFGGGTQVVDAGISLADGRSLNEALVINMSDLDLSSPPTQAAINYQGTSVFTLTLNLSQVSLRGGTSSSANFPADAILLPSADLNINTSGQARIAGGNNVAQYSLGGKGISARSLICSGDLEVVGGAGEYRPGEAIRIEGGALSVTHGELTAKAVRANGIEVRNSDITVAKGASLVAEGDMGIRASGGDIILFGSLDAKALGQFALSIGEVIFSDPQAHLTAANAGAQSSIDVSIAPSVEGYDFVARGGIKVYKNPDSADISATSGELFLVSLLVPTVPSFAPQQVGTIQMDARPISIASNATSEVHNVSVDLSDHNAFSLIPGDGTIAAGTTNTSWKMHPKSDLAPGVYTTDVIIMVGATTHHVKQVSFEVTASAAPKPLDPGNPASTPVVALAATGDEARFPASTIFVSFLVSAAALLTWSRSKKRSSNR